MEKFKTYLMEDLIDEIAMGPFGSNIKVDCFVSDGIPVLNGSNLMGFKLNEDSFNYVTPEKADSLNKANAYRGDIVITHRGTLGQIVYIPENSLYDRYVISQSQFRIKLNKQLALPEYVVYYFHTRIGQYRLLANASQVGVPAIARPTSTFRKVEIELPSLNEQKRIVSILDSLSNKIELNNRINHNLEEQAQALYKSWFVDFEPFKNGKFVDSEIGIIPEGWIVADIGEYCRIQSGYAFKSSWWQDCGVKVIKIKNITSTGKLDMNDCSYVSNEHAKMAKAFQTHRGDLLIAMTGATIGKFCVVQTNEKYCVNQRVGKFFLGDNPLDRLPFIYCCLKREDVYNEVVNRGQGSAQPNISGKDIETIRIVFPPQNILLQFNQRLKSSFEKMTILEEESVRLTALRDNLLALLIKS